MLKGYKRKNINSNSTLNYGVLILPDRLEFCVALSTGVLNIYNLHSCRYKLNIRVSSYFIWPMVKVDKDILVISGGGRYYGQNRVQIAVINVNSRTKVRTMNGHTNSVYGLCKIRKDFVASFSDDCTVKLWNWRTGTLLYTFPKAQYKMTCGLFDGRRLLVGGYDRHIGVYGLPKNCTSATAEKKINVHYDVQSMISIGKPYEIAIGMQNRIELWNYLDQTKLKKFSLLGGWVYNMCYGYPKTLYAIGGNKIHIFDINKRKLIESIKSKDTLVGIDVLKDGHIFTCGYSRNIERVKTNYKFLTFKSSTKIFKSDDDVLPAYELIMRSNIFDITLTFDTLEKTKTKKLNFFKSFLINSKLKNIDNRKTIHIPEVIDVFPEESFLRLFFGINSVLNEKKLFDYYLFFKTLGMKKRAYLICKRIGSIDNIGVLLYLFKRSSLKFEGLSEENEKVAKKTEKIEYGKLTKKGKGADKIIPKFKKFSSGFSLGIFNEFKLREEKILSKKKLFKAFQYEKLIIRLKEHYIEPIFSHSEFKYKSNTVPLSFNQIFVEDLKEVFKKRIFQKRVKYSNVKIRCIDDGKKEFSAHLQFLIYRSNYFQRFRSIKGVIEIEKYSANLIEELLNFIYFDYIKTDNVTLLFQLLVHSKVYIEKRLKSKVIKKLSDITRKIITKIGIILFLEKYSDIVKNEEVVKELVGCWALAGRVTTGDIYKHIEKSESNLRLIFVSNRIDKLEHEGKELNALYALLENRLDELDLIGNERVDERKRGIVREIKKEKPKVKKSKIQKFFQSESLTDDIDDDIAMFQKNTIVNQKRREKKAKEIRERIKNKQIEEEAKREKDKLEGNLTSENEKQE